MDHIEIEKSIAEERKILAMHQENLDSFLDQGFKGFIDDETLNAMFNANQDPYQKYKQEYSRLIKEVEESGQKIIRMNYDLRKELLRNAQK